MTRLLAVLLAAVLPLQAAFAQHPHPQPTAQPAAQHQVHQQGPQSQQLGSGVKVTMVYEQEIPNMPGKSVKGVLVEYEPGGVNPAHTHAKSALIYATVLEGAVLNQLNGGPVRTFTKGQNFTEMPGDRHEVSANASKTEPAKLLAVFVVDTNDTVLTTPIQPAK